MSAKILVIFASAEKEKVLTGMMYARNAVTQKWLDEVKIVFFGPIEKLMVEDEEVREAAIKLTEVSECVACKAISEEKAITEKLSKLGVKVEYVGSIISNYMKKGYTPMVW